ncbi:hypothetical protein UlMin_003210 [Ulmus minor]
MPKEKRDRSVSCDKCRAFLYTCSFSNRKRPSTKIPAMLEEDVKEWEEARCLVCMEHPHNAVLLICSSHEKGCRPYMCDTSYRHSNCLDQFHKSFAAKTSSAKAPLEGVQLPTTHLSPAHIFESTITTKMLDQTIEEVTPSSCEHQTALKLVCPLCGGDIKEWIVVEDARHPMNAKSRSCSYETCNFSGTYIDLRKHAKLEHPLVWPSEADPEREHNWRRLTGEESVLPIHDGGWLTVFFLIRVFQPRSSSSRSSSWSGTSIAIAQLSIRMRSTRLWGKSYEEETGFSCRKENNDNSNEGSVPWRRRSEHLRRRTTPDNQP